MGLNWEFQFQMIYEMLFHPAKIFFPSRTIVDLKDIDYWEKIQITDNNSFYLYTFHQSSMQHQLLAALIQYINKSIHLEPEYAPAKAGEEDKMMVSLQDTPLH